MHRRRGVGVKAVKARKKESEQFANVASQMEATESTHVAEFLASFKTSLEEFARKHKRKIREDPVFRQQFTKMCYEIGVDPLRSSKGFWADALGVGDFYYEVAVKVVECCASSRGENGGLIAIDDLLDRLRDDQLTRDDVKRSVAKLGALGDGFRVVNDNAVLSVSAEFNDDSAKALDVAAKNGGGLDTNALARHLSGADGRARAAAVLEGLLTSGFAWVDDQASDADGFVNVGHRQFFFPSIWLDHQNKQAADSSSNLAS